MMLSKGRDGALDQRKAVALLAVLMIVAFLALSRAAAAVTYETKPAFCEGSVVRNYLAPLERLPKLHSPPLTGRLDFGPNSLHLKPTPSLLVGEGAVGYGLSLDRREPVRLDWDVTTTLARVDWRGRVVEVQDQTRRHLGRVTPKHGAGVRLTVSDEPAAYRLTAVFRSASGRKLGGFGFYVRVVEPTRNARLALNATSYRPENTVFGRIENIGSEAALYGAEYAIERLEGPAWIRVPESLRAFTFIGYTAGPGLAGNACSGFWIPPAMPPGRYRMSKEIWFGPQALNDHQSTLLTAEFDISP